MSDVPPPSPPLPPPTPGTGYTGAAYLGPPSSIRQRQPIGLAVTSLILALIGCCSGSVPMIMSLMALSRVRRGEGGGRGIAQAALVISCLWLVFTIGSVVVAVKLLTFRDANGQFTSEGYQAASELRVGDCLDRPGGHPYFVKVGPCSLPHETELFSRLPLSGPPSGYAALCAPDFKKYVGVKPERSKLILSASVIRQSQFGGERSIICLVGLPGGEETAGTLQNYRG